jgi:hypothetical protein
METVTPWTSGIEDTPRNAIDALAAWLADVPQWIGTRLFMSGEEEAYWRGWQITRLRGGLGRGYRDARFASPAKDSQARETSPF